MDQVEVVRTMDGTSVGSESVEGAMEQEAVEDGTTDGSGSSRRSDG